MDLTKAAEVKISNTGTQKYEWTNFPDDEYLWVQMSSRSDDASAEFQTYAIIDKAVSPSAPPPVVTPNSPGATPSNSTTSSSTSASAPLSLIIGVVVGAVAIVGGMGYLIYYKLKQKQQLLQLKEQ